MCTPDGRMLDTRIFRSYQHKTVRFASPNIEFGSVPARHVSFVVAFASYLSGNSGLPRCYRGTPHSWSSTGTRARDRARAPSSPGTLAGSASLRGSAARSAAFVFSGVDSHFCILVIGVAARCIAVYNGRSQRTGQWRSAHGSVHAGHASRMETRNGQLPSAPLQATSRLVVAPN